MSALSICPAAALHEILKTLCFVQPEVAHAPWLTLEKQWTDRMAGLSRSRSLARFQGSRRVGFSSPSMCDPFIDTVSASYTPE